jgi:energy-coupling factor transporter ATP-binding protein EcfA2
LTVDWPTLAPPILGAVVGAFSVLVARPLNSFIRRLLSLADERKRLKELRSLNERLRPSAKITIRDLDVRMPGNRLKGPFFYITQLRLQDFRCFPDAVVDFRYPGEEKSDLKYSNVNLLLGNNGSGKSTVLRAVALVALSEVVGSSGFTPYRLVRQGADTARIAAAFAGRGPDGAEPLLTEMQIEPLGRGTLERISSATDGFWRGIFDDVSPQFFVAGYGVNRRVAQKSSDPALEDAGAAVRFNRVRGLFNEHTPLAPFGEWLPSALERRPRELRELLTELLPEKTQLTSRFEDEQPVFRRHGIEIPFRALSDGMQSYIGWLGDLLHQLDSVAGARDLRDVGGLVLVDEVDLLLHPSWQRVVVPIISDMFRKIQFVFTTHSPIVAGTLESGNIVVAREVDDTGTSTLRRIDAEVHGLNAEQVLLSSYFNLTSTRSEDITATLDELAQRAVDGDDSARRRYMQALVEGWAAEESSQ